tara:strand:+ start:1261 stop:1995 length:735 start_codon:yes stop_codon:yes gene_type:complete
MDVAKIFDAHERIILMCSGGKDSVAALYYLEDYWDKLIVGWVNTGDLVPEVESFMQEISRTVPNFIAMYSDSIKWRNENGWPSRVVPVGNTLLEKHIGGTGSFNVTAYHNCCKANIWVPLKQLVDKTKATAVLMGQRQEDDLKNPLKNGQWSEGFQIFYPINDWSTEDVLEYLKQKRISHDRFSAGDTSIDCVTCTGYPQYTDRTAYIKKHHPVAYKEVLRRWNLIAAANLQEQTVLQSALNRG